MSHCPLMTDVPAPLPYPALEKSETSDPGLPARAESAAERCTSPAAGVSLQPCSLAAKSWRYQQMGEGNLAKVRFGSQGTEQAHKCGYMHRPFLHWRYRWWQPAERLLAIIYLFIYTYIYIYLTFFLKLKAPLKSCLGEEEQARGAFTPHLKAMPGSAQKPGPHHRQLAFRNPSLWQTALLAAA